MGDQDDLGDQDLGDQDDLGGSSRDDIRVSRIVCWPRIWHKSKQCGRRAECLPMRYYFTASLDYSRTPVPANFSRALQRSTCSSGIL